MSIRQSSTGWPLVAGRFCGGRLKRRVVRGGSFDNNQNNVRCAYRNRNDTDNRNNNVGFRVVAHGFHPNVSSVRWAEFCTGYGLCSANGLPVQPVPGRVLPPPNLPRAQRAPGGGWEEAGRANTKGVCALSVYLSAAGESFAFPVPQRVRLDDQNGTDPPPVLS